MDRKKGQDKGKHIDKLDPEPRTRYLQKLSILNGFDPRDSAESDWSKNVDLITPVDFPGLMHYLIYGVSAYH